jgi:glycosyltransferase involved in cell wall biosynthesis
LFYESYGIPDGRLLSCPYSVDNDRFKKESKSLELCSSNIKQRLGIPVDAKIILSTAKYIDKKRPLDLLQAFSQLNDERCWLIMVGEGTLRKEMEDLIKIKKLKQVILTGFVNQSSISEYYAISNVFVMCSSVGENWGLSVNEAMNFDLPVIVSDLTGCSTDLIKEGINGYVFQTGNVSELTYKLKQVLVEKKLTWSVPSEKIVEDFSYNSIAKNIKYIL